VILGPDSTNKKASRRPVILRGCCCFAAAKAASGMLFKEALFSFGRLSHRSTLA
jgi:hypothetical protein